MTDLQKLNMDDEYINQNDIVKRYLQNKLTPEETVEFEVYMLDKPELLERLELDMVLVETLPKIETIEKQKTNERTELKPSFWQVLLGTPAKASFGTGLACAIAALLLFPILQNQNIASSIGNNIQLYYPSDVRGSSDFEYKFNVAKATDTLIFVLETEFEQPSAFTVLLTNEDTDEQIPVSGNYQTSEDGELYVPISRQDMPSGKYRFEYYPINNKTKKQSSRLILD